jgi:hypothetical protein
LIVQRNRPNLAVMVKLFAKSQPEDRPGELPIEAKLRELVALRAAATLQILALEKSGAVRGGAAPDTTVSELASAFLGDTRASHRGKTLDELYADREAIDLAIEIGQRRAIEAHGRIVEERVAERADAWRNLVNARVLAIATLRRLNDEADDFVADLSSGGQRAPMPLHFPSAKLLGSDRQGGGPARDFIEAAIRAGVVSEKEIRNA